MGLAKLEYQGDFKTNDVITYAHTSAVTAWVPISTAFGVLVPMETADANVSITYYCQGRFLADIATAVTVSQFDVLYYDSAADKVQTTVPTAGFLIGIATKDGTATAGYVELQLFPYPFSGGTSTSAKEEVRVINTNSATSGTIRGINVRSYMTGTGTEDGEALRAYTLISGTITGSGVHGAHITAQIGDENAASKATCTGEVSGVRATIGIGLTNTAPVGGTIASLRLDSYFQSTAASAASSFIYACDVSTYGVDAILRLGTIVGRTTSKATITAPYAYVSGKMAMGSASIALKVVTPDGSFYIPGLLASDLS